MTIMLRYANAVTREVEHDQNEYSKAIKIDKAEFEYLIEEAYKKKRDQSVRSSRLTKDDWQKQTEEEQVKQR